MEPEPAFRLPSPTHKAATLEKSETTSALTKVPTPAPSLASLFAGQEAAKAEAPGWMPPTPPGKICELGSFGYRLAAADRA